MYSHEVKRLKILIMGERARYDRFMPDSDFIKSCELVFVPRGATAAEALDAAADADILFADAISIVSGEQIRGMKNLKLIHSEGVACNGFDLKTARELGINVCNNKGANAHSVAEQAIYLMLGYLRSAVTGDAAVRAGLQIQTKERAMRDGITELGECTVGIVGLGDIGLATVKLLKTFGCEICYWNRHRKPEAEEEFGIEYLSLNELAAQSDIVSLHLAVTPETTNICGREFISHMKKNAFIVNTARGELVDNEALRDAIIENRIAGASLDCVAPEPVKTDNVLLNLPEEYKYKILFSPHLGGITTRAFRRIYTHMWQNAERVANGLEPDCIVNL